MLDCFTPLFLLTNTNSNFYVQRCINVAGKNISALNSYYNVNISHMNPKCLCLYEVLVQTFPNGPCTPQLFIFFMKCLTIFILIGLSAEIKIGNSKLEINTVYQII